MIIFVGPNSRLPRHVSDQDTVVRGVEGLLEAAYSTRPEHAEVKARVAELNRWSAAIAEAFGAALDEELQDFWQAYSGWFAMYAVGPLVANWQIARRALSETTPVAVRIIENWRRRPWWSGRYQVAPAILDEARARGLRCTLEPGQALRRLQPLVMLWGASGQRREALRHEVAAAFRATRQPGEPPVQGAALWLSVGASSAQLMARLIPGLQERHGLRSEIVDFHYYQSAEACHAHGLAARDIMGFATDEALEEARRNRHWRRWWQDFRRRADRLPCRDELPPCLFAALRDRIRLILYRDAALWRLWSEASQRALDAYAPAVVLTFHVYGPVVMPLLVEARRRSIPCLCLQHGAIGPRYLTIPSPPYAETLVFGEYARGIMQQTSPAGTAVRVTGHCLYDSAQAGAAPVPRPEVARLAAGVNGLVVLCAQFNEATYYDRERWWMAEVARSCRELDARLVIKVHPSDSAEAVGRYRTLERSADGAVVVVPHGQYPLEELLAACDVMVTRDSTAVFEANLLDKPVVTINLSPWEEELPYAATGGALGVYRFEDIQPALTRALLDSATREALAKSRPEFLRLHTGPADGQATARICDAIAGWAGRETGPQG